MKPYPLTKWVTEGSSVVGLIVAHGRQVSSMRMDDMKPLASGTEESVLLPPSFITMTSLAGNSNEGLKPRL